MADLGPRQLLQNVPFLVGLSMEELDGLAAALRRRRFRKNEVIFHRDDPGNSLYVIVSGTIKVSLRSEDGKEITLTLLGPGDHVGELALLDGEPRSADATATEAVEVLVLPREVFMHFLETNEGAAIRLLAAFTRQYVRRLTDSLQDSAFLDVPRRLARTLVHLMGSASSGGATQELRLRITQSDLASMVGATRESTNKWLGHYERLGWVRRERGGLLILKPQELVKEVG